MRPRARCASAARTGSRTTDGDQRPARSEQVEHDRRGERAERHCDDHDQLEEAEDTTEQAPVDVLLHAREARDVEEAVGEAGYGEGDEGNPGLRPDSDQRKRQAPAGERELKRSAEATATDERDSGEGTGEAAETESRHERAHPGLADPEHVDRDDDDDHTQRATHESLGAEERDDEPHRRVACERVHTLPQFPQDPGTHAGSGRRGAGADPRDRDEREKRDRGASREDGGRPRHREQTRRPRGDRPAQPPTPARAPPRSRRTAHAATVRAAAPTPGGTAGGRPAAPRPAPPTRRRRSAERRKRAPRRRPGRRLLG